MGNFDRTRWFNRIFKMDVTIWLSVLLAVITLGTPASSSEPRVVCYYTNWSVYRPGTARFNPQNINPYLCTHLIYAFGGFTKDNTLKPFDKYQDIEKGGYAKFTGLKTYNKELKTLLAIGGWNEGSSRFSPMVAARERRKEFVRNAIKFLRQNRFDGLDLDWEYPAFRDGSKPKDRENYAKLVKELREEFEKESQKTGKPRLLLTMAVPAGIEYIEKGYDVKTLNQYLDWLNLLTYDYHSAFEPAVNHHAPLYPLEEPNEYSVDNELNIDYTIQFYLENGADADKLVLGIPTYGRSYTLFNPDAVEIGSPADGPGEQGDATREKGYLAYYEICEGLMPKQKKRRQASEEDSEEYEDDDEEQEPNWTVMYPNPDAMGPVAYRGNQWVGYDDVDIVKKKAQYVAENGLGGIMFWSIDNDDFRGVCHDKPYPLIEAAKEAYFQKLASTDITVTKKTKTATNRISNTRKKSKPRTTTTTTTTERTTKTSKRTTSTTPSWNVTPEPPTTPDPGADFKCVDEGFYQHPRDCKKYFWCLDSGPSNLGIVAHQFTCPSGLYFNKAADSCDFARNVPCKKTAPTTKAPTTKSPTTRASSTTTTTTTTTTRRPIRLSTKSSSLFRTTTTTTARPEPEEEYEDELSEDVTDEDAEDPRVIKELIDLIKKVGGIEQLEKQLGLGETPVSTGGAITTTPSSFNKKLYQKVLERTRGKNRYSSNSILGNAAQTSRRGPQNAGLEPTNDRDILLKRDRPQYTTINRQRASSSTTEEPLDAEESEEEVEIEEEALPVSRAKSVESRPSVATTAKPLQYVNIRRGKPATSENSETTDNSASRNALFERTEPLVTVSDTPESLDVVGLRRENVPEYVTIRRQRPTTEETTTEAYENTEKEDEAQDAALEKEISTQPQYSTILRSRSTTPTEEPNTVTPLNKVRSSTLLPETSSISDPTTVLTVQISSFLNSPSAAETENPELESAVTTETAEPTTISSSTTTTTTTTPPASTRRINLIRRRGSTTTSAPSSSTTTQVSPRNYSLVKRRRPLLRPNEITSDSDNNNDLSRKIRSTTPDSREVNNITETRSSRFRIRNNRFRSPQARSDDSIPAAASPFLREEATPDNMDEVISLTLNDASPQFPPKQSFSSRFQGRFRRPTSSINTASEIVPDSEVSAATVEASKPNLVSRGRSKFLLSSISDATAQSTTTASTAQRRPTFARFSPRPFTRASTSPVSTVSEEVPIEVATQRIPSRLPFGRTRPIPSIAGRKLPFPSRQSTTQQTLTNEDDDNDDDDDYSEIKTDDIMLSESAREENEHIEPEITTEADIPKRRVIIKKLRPPGVTETQLISTETIPIDDAGKKRFRVIRRRPSSTTITPEVEAATETVSGPGPQRIRKIIRKKVKPSEDAPNITAKAIGSLSFKGSTTEFNYGEKTRPIITTTTTEAEPEPVIEVLTEFYKEENKIQPEVQQKTQLEIQSNTNIQSETQPDTQSGIQPENIETEIELIIDSQVTEKSIETVIDKQEEIIHVETTTVPSTTEVQPDTKISNDQEIEMKLETAVSYPQDNTEPTKLETDVNASQGNAEPILENENNAQTEAKDYINGSSEESETDSNVELEAKDEIITDSAENISNISDNKQISESDSPITQTEASQTETTTVTTTVSTTPLPRSRLPYKPRKKSFTPSTEPSLPSSSRIFSRKYNPGVYTSPATADKPQLKTAGAVTRRPFSSRIFTRRPFTPRTTQKVVEEEYHDVEVLEEGDEPEQENPFVFVPPNQLFTRKPDSVEDDEDAANSEELLEEGEGEENYEEEEQIDEIPPKFAFTTKRPGFKPRVVNSNTFRTSTTTTELPKLLGSSQNRTGLITRFGSNKPINDAKKRVQNVPPGYNSPVNALNTKLILGVVKNETQQSEKSENNVTVTSSVTIENIENATVDDDDDYLTATTTAIDGKDLTIPDNISTTTSFEADTATAEMELDSSTDDYLEFSEVTTSYPAVQDIYTTSGQPEFIVKTTNAENPATDTVSTTEGVTEQFIIATTTTTPSVSPIIKTQFDKLFSISRVVEVNSKQDKHRLNKNNKTTLIEEGKIKVEKRPVVDKIGEVSRYSLIKIVEDEIPIYLTKFGHIYPVENPPDNIIRIDEARNARALNENFSDVPRENLVASESINEAYRHVREDSADIDNRGIVQHVPNDEFLKYVNDDKKDDKNQDIPLYTQWQFVPAAYETEQIKAAKKYEIVTPRSMHTKQSTLPLEGLFKTDTPAMGRKVSDQNNQPFFVFSDMVPNQQEPVNIDKVSVIKPETSHSIVTFAKGQAFNVDSSVEEASVKNTIKISVSPQLDVNSMLSFPSTTTDSISSVSITVVTEGTSSPIINLLTATQPVIETSSTTYATSTTTTTEDSTTQSITEESSTVKTSPADVKRSKFSLPRRPIIKSSNFTRPPIIFRSTKKINSTTTLNLNQKANKTTFNPTKSRFSVNRVQNVPVDLRRKTNSAKQTTRIFTTTKSYTTESPKTTTERKVYFKPIRPNFRPSFASRKTTPSVTTGGDT